MGTSSAIPIILTFLAVLILRRLTWRKRYPSPPGPRPLPIIGNIHQFPPSKPQVDWKEWGKKYGPMFQLKLLSQPMLIINSHRIATELMTERGAIYSGRPDQQMVNMCGWEEMGSLMDPCETQREQRKIYQMSLEGRKVEKFRAHLESEVRKFAVRLFRDPVEFLRHVRSNAGAIIFLISHGYVVDHTPGKDPFILLAERVISEVSDSLAPGKWLVDTIPMLKHVPSWFPGAIFKRVAEAYRANMYRFAGEPIERVKSEIEAGTALPSLAQMLLEEVDDDQSSQKENENNIKWATAALFLGGSDTSVAVVWTFFLAMSRHPEMLAKAQEELAAVVDLERLPVLEDRPNLPYVEAILTESLRYGHPAPLGIPHKNLADDVYNGFFIEKGTTIIPNIWAMMNDDEVFPDPREFSPERFLQTDANGRLKYVANEVDPRTVIFGYGRRVCPGRELASLSMWNTISLTLHLFSITSKEPNPPTLRKHEWEDGFVSHPVAFECVIKPRSPAAEELLIQLEQSDLSLHI